MFKSLSLKKYKFMLKEAIIKGYKFKKFNEYNYKNIQTVKDGLILLRHDIDASPKAALKMAEIENEINIQSTYFLMIRSPLYNLFSRSTSKYIKQLINLGHEIGLHYDANFEKLQKTSNEINKDLIKQCEIFENEFNIKLSSVSFHQPSKDIMDRKYISPTHLLNTYSEEINQKFKYFSDTNQSLRWIEDDKTLIENSLSSLYPKNIQLLIHPLWWVFNQATPQDTWTKTLIEIFEESQKQLVETERAFGQKRNVFLEF